jgi:hypothetical protein
MQPFVLIWSTGWVVAEMALREIGMEGMQAEYGPFCELDLVKLLPLETEIAEQTEKMEQRRQTAKATKKRRKRSTEELEADHIGDEGVAEHKTLHIDDNRRPKKVNRTTHAPAGVCIYKQCV